MKKRVFAAIFFTWVGLWLFFVSKELLHKGYLHDYKALSGKSLEGKRSYVTGDRFYSFLMFCKDKMPAGSGYGLRGIEDGSIEQRRASYYLYPDMNRENPEFILVYDEPGLTEKGYRFFAGLDETRYILKK